MAASRDENDGDTDSPTACEVGIDTQCGRNERCVKPQKHSRSGYCTCEEGFNRDTAGDCVPPTNSNILSRLSPLNAHFLDSVDASDPNSKVLKANI